MKALIACSALFLCACTEIACAGGSAGGTAPRFDCRTDDGRCPELPISGDPPARLVGFGPAPLRGYADPSLRRDPRTGALYLSYSWVSTFVSRGFVPGRPLIDIGVSTHLARSDDGGRTFRFVKSLWSSASERYESRQGYAEHEVSTISPTRRGWAVLALRYFNPLGNGNDLKADSLFFELAEGADPERLNTGKVLRLGGPLTSGLWRPFIDLSRIAGVGTACPVWTEPSLFEDANALYLLAQCKTPQEPAAGFLGLFVRTANGWRWSGKLTRPGDAAALGGNELTQADLVRGRNGQVLLLVTPDVVQGRDEHHLGCAVLGIHTLAPPKLQRSVGGAPIVRARVTSSDSMRLGPGACAYDARSRSGLLIVRRASSGSGGIVFSIHSTGLFF